MMDGYNLEVYKPSEIAKYIRLSLADEERLDESESIINQRRVLNEFINKNGNDGSSCPEFIDDGISGTNFNRPGWNSLQECMETGKIKVVITKNLSRLGRSNFECSYFLDYFFPTNNIRYIAMQEQIDTANSNNSNNEYAALNNFINEKYSRDLSKNIRRVYKVKQTSGEYMGGIPIYGYIKSPDDKHKLIIDEEAANVVRRIFSLYLELGSQNAIMKILSDEKVPIPEVYKKTKRGIKAKYPYEWNNHTIRCILRNEMYIGNMVQNVHNKKSFREKKLIKMDKEDWIIVQNTHDAIIDKDTFYRVQNLLDANYRRPVKKDEKLFSGIMYCFECGHKIGIASPKKENGYSYTYCNYYRKNSRYNKCTSHTINYEKLEEELLGIISSLFSKYKDSIDYKNIINNRLKKINTYEYDLKKKINELKIDIESIKLKQEKLYMDRLDDIITSSMYVSLSDKLNEQVMLKEKEKKELKKSLDKCINDEYVKNIFDFNVIVDEYLRSKKNISREFILKLIKKVEIHDNKKVDLYMKINVVKTL